MPVVRRSYPRASGAARRRAAHLVALRMPTRRSQTVGPRRGSGAILGSAIAVVLAGSIGAAGLAALAATATVAYLSQDLPDPSQLEDLTFAQPTLVYDRDRSVELGRFQREQRRVVTYQDVPRLVLDATTTAEDRTFWENPGVDPAAIVSAVADNIATERERGASTITQQLVRARLLPEDAVGPGSDRYVRKVKEIIQSLRLTDEFPGEVGKERVITAYLNEIFYGRGAYGIAAAARVYFGVSNLEELSPAQAALLAGLPQSPSTLDPYLYAEQDDEGRLVVPSDSPPVVRRDWIIQNLSTSRWTRLTSSERKAALEEPVVLSGTQPIRFRAGHLTWQVRRQLQAIVGPDVELETAGLRVTTTLDWKAQQVAEKWVTAATIVPNLPKEEANALLKRLDIPRDDRRWVRDLRGKDLHNAALVAIDYRTGDVLAYIGSAGYDRDDLASPQFDPKYDAAGDAHRQPGSAFKPIVYATGFEQRVLTPGSVLLDITTEFDPARDWAPRDADRLDRGPVLVRDALQQSLNIPAIRALHRVGSEAVADQAEAFGLRFQGGRDAFLQAGLSGALGTVEVRPLDLTSSYGTLANGGVRMPPRMILEVRASDGSVVWSAGDPVGEQVISEEAAHLVTSILDGNTHPRRNETWARHLVVRNGPDGERRPAAAKTGTAQDARDLATYGYLAPPEGAEDPGLAVGVWMGNSDHTTPDARRPATSLTAAAPLWRAFMREYTDGWEIARFVQPEGVVRAEIDLYSGGRPGPWTRDTRTESFIARTQPGGRDEVDPAGLLYSRACGGWRVDPVAVETGPKAWREDVETWVTLARRGPGRTGPYDSTTAYFFGRSSWGGQLVGPCPRAKPKPTPKPKPKPPPKPDKTDEPDKPDKPEEKPEEKPKPSRGPDPSPPEEEREEASASPESESGSEPESGSSDD